MYADFLILIEQSRFIIQFAYANIFTKNYLVWLKVEKVSEAKLDFLCMLFHLKNSLTSLQIQLRINERKTKERVSYEP